MKLADYIPAHAALERLGIKPQTLYAYVSRGLIKAVSDPTDSRKSLYATHDVEAVAKRRRRPRARADVAAGTIAWGEPVLESGISTIREGRLEFRGEPAVDLADTFTLEDMCCLHWRTAEAPPKTGSENNRSKASHARERLFADLARLAAKPMPNHAPSRDDLIKEAWAVLNCAATAICGAPSDAPIHERLAALWTLGVEGEALIRRALVLISDHELNPSTFAVRVAASTGSSLAAATLAGLATLSGPRHGEASSETLAYLKAHLAGQDETPPMLTGFGHPLYPAGDPRADALLASIRPHRDTQRALDALARTSGERPNVDTALAIMALECGLPDDAPFLIFAMGRMSGWIAHALEQIRYGDLIRPRARFVAR